MSSKPPATEPETIGEGSPAWDEEWAASLIGKYALVSVHFYEDDGETIEYEAHYHGRIISADREAGFAIECEGKWQGQILKLPPDLRAFEPAPPGRYTLKSTGEFVDDPDVLTGWAMTDPKKCQIEGGEHEH